MLRRFDTGEADRVVWLLTPDRGRIAAFAASARRSQRRFGGAIEPFTLISAQLTAPTRGDLFRLLDAQVLDAHAGIRASLEATACGSVACELIATLAVENGAQHGTGPSPAGHYEVLLAYLRRLSRQPAAADDLYRLLLMALDVSGLRPRFTTCARCGRADLTGHEWFDASEGGRLCESCRPRGPGARPLSSALLTALRAFETGAAECPLEGRALLWEYTQHQLGRPVKSLSLLQELGY